MPPAVKLIMTVASMQRNFLWSMADFESLACSAFALASIFGQSVEGRPGEDG